MKNDEIKKWVSFINNSMKTIEEKEDAMRFIMEPSMKQPSMRYLTDSNHGLFDKELLERQLSRNPANELDTLMAYAYLHKKRS